LNRWSPAPGRIAPVSRYGPTWHCVVGADFTSNVTHESKNFIFFYHGKTAICLYKCG